MDCSACLGSRRALHPEGAEGACAPARLCAVNSSAPRTLLVGLLALLLTACGRDDADERPVGPAPASAMAHYLEPAAAPRPVVAQAPAAPKPAGPLPEDASCISAECHASFASARQIHGPVAAGECSTCHQADAGGHRYPLKRAGDETCTFCHKTGSSQPHQHAALSGGGGAGCLSCHQPHVSHGKFLLNKLTVEQVCSQCHNVPLKTHAHDPFVRGQCTLCHQPHESRFARLLRGGEGSQHCFMCHDGMQRSLAGMPQVHKPVLESCTSCHAAHSGDGAHQLKTDVQATCTSCHDKIEQHIARASSPHQAVFTEESCVNCHTPHAATRPKLLREREDKLCLSCHSKAIAAADGRTIPDMAPTLARQFLHGPIKSGECSVCHDAHGGTHSQLLKENFPKSFYQSFDLENYALCFRCHDKGLVLEEKTTGLTAFRDGERNLHYLHVSRQDKGRTCKTCHAIHGSDLPAHMASEVPFEGSRWAMPIRFKKRDDGGSCAPGCHEAKQYRRPPEPAQAQDAPGGVL